MQDINYKKIRFVLFIILLANLVVAFTKIVLGSIIKSSSMTSDGFHSLADGSSNIVGLIGIYFASKPVDTEHPYGHHKFEVLASLFISGMLLVMGGNIILQATNRLRYPIVPIITIESLVILLITLCINIFVCVYEYRQGQSLHSQILISDSMHTKSDIFVSLGVLITLIGITLGLPIILDSMVSFVVAGFILHASYEIFMENSAILLDKVMIDADLVRSIVLQFNQVHDVHNIRSRGTQNDVFIDMHVMTQPNLSVEESHILTHAIEHEIRNTLHTNVQLIAHLEPYEERHIDS